MSIGQSNSIGACDEIEADSLISSDVPLPRFNNLKCEKVNNIFEISPLTHRLRAISGDWRGLSPMIYMADAVTAFSRKYNREDIPSISISAGSGGNGYSVLKKNGSGPEYNLSLQAINACNEYAKAKGKSFQMKALICIHGESDAQISNVNYADNLIEWINDYNSDIKSITGQTEPVKMFVSQLSWGPSYPGGDADMLIKNQQWGAAKKSDKIILACPTYMLDITIGDKISGDWAHFDAESLRRLGEYFAKAYSYEENSDRHWVPLSPKQIDITGNRIDIQFNVLFPPLTWNSDIVCIDNNHGFEFIDMGNPSVHITNVEISGPEKISIQLNRSPSQGKKILYYAYSERFKCNGEEYFRGRGQLTDSDTTKSLWNYDLRNYCISFSHSFDAVNVNDKEKFNSNYVLGSNYPNPFNITTQIDYHLAENEDVYIQVFNCLGQKIFSFLEPDKAAGDYNFIFNREHLASGIYFIKVQLGNYSRIMKIQLLK